jgi:Holliday junction resolvase RusA-like endonuclease
MTTPASQSERLLHVRVYGKPIGQGNLTHFGKGRPTIHQNQAVLLPWRAEIIRAVQAAMPGWGISAPLDGPLALSAVFWMPRGKTVRRGEPTVPPDTDHLLRALGDALTQAGAIADDARITCFRYVAKRYADVEHPPGVAFYLETDPGGVVDLEVAA